MSTPSASPEPVAAPASQANSPEPSGGGSQRQLSTFLKISIILLAALTVASISLLFIGDFQGKFERVFATFFVFAVFVGLTALDTRRELKSEWYAPVALIANSYILALLLIVTWMTPYDPFGLGWALLWKGIVVVGVTRLVLLCCQGLLSMSEGKPESIGRFAFITSMLAVLSGILFTAPIAIETFNVHIPELYWKIAVATLILTALGLAITLLLRWFYGAPERDAQRAQRAASFPAEPYRAAPRAVAHDGQAPRAPQAPAVPAAAPTGAPAAHTQEAPAAPDATRPLLPWPTFADGRPIPPRADGQPDFSVPGAPRPPQ
ncbi:hypothetical protein [Leucobacter luti]|uniref:Uncharacterized protein n=1 Tax=Leucobacter luti TaxID=340320 RepID=A0A4Q7TYS8_9MICO|nr:hypothetical protein [Leucobacter luti]MBL3698963.1 hypothetical protein [Leucobacter luti]RZT66341.1 hypothetical protein EV139_1777 [Leucobacter luti]